MRMSFSATRATTPVASEKNKGEDGHEHDQHEALKRRPRTEAHQASEVSRERVSRASAIRFQVSSVVGTRARTTSAELARRHERVLLNGDRPLWPPAAGRERPSRQLAACSSNSDKSKRPRRQMSAAPRQDNDAKRRPRAPICIMIEREPLTLAGPICARRCWIMRDHYVNAAQTSLRAGGRAGERASGRWRLVWAGARARRARPTSRGKFLKVLPKLSLFSAAASRPNDREARAAKCCEHSLGARQIGRLVSPI